MTSMGTQRYSHHTSCDLAATVRGGPANARQTQQRIGQPADRLLIPPVRILCHNGSVTPNRVDRVA
jgi:hypothetical protein